MAWEHDSHDVIMMVQEPKGPGSIYGPYCRSCDKAMFYLVVPTDEDMARASAWLKKNKERLESLS